MRQARQVCREMLIGLLLWFAVIGLLLAVIAEHKIAAVAGAAVGTGTAAGLILHMYRHLDIALDMDARHAQSHIQFAALRRMFFAGLVIAASMFLSEYMHPVGVVLGVFGVKATALGYPILHRRLERFWKKR